MPEAEPSVPWCLKPAAVAGFSQRIPVVGVVTLGRAGSNTVALPESDHPHVSGHHARIACAEDGILRLEDLGSRNGTFVNDRRVQSTVLRDGDVVRLGEGGPRFVVESTTARVNLTQPVVLEPGSEPRTPLTQSTVVRVKRALGIPDHADVGRLMAASEHRARRRLVLAAGAGILLAIGAVLVVRSLQHEELGQLAALNAELESRLSHVSRSFESQQAAWEEQKLRLENERSSLQQRIQELASREQGSQTEMGNLRKALDDTNERLLRYDPIVVERTKQEGIGRVQRAVVFVETKLQLRNSKTKKLLRVREATMTFDDDAAVFEQESSGSGFCIAADGLIVTNAHVVHPEGFDAEITIGPEENLRPELALAVVFSGDETRHPARIVRVLSEGDDDLALLKIEPFVDMPHIADFHSDTAVPSTGAEVYLHGFPLGMMALQEGRRVIASSFKGILSRTVSNWLQVDAAVHPGNSGGPLTDGAGRVIGVVTRVQRITADAIAPDMGYAIPIGAVARLMTEPASAQPK